MEYAEGPYGTPRAAQMRSNPHSPPPPIPAIAVGHLSPTIPAHPRLPDSSPSPVRTSSSSVSLSSSSSLPPFSPCPTPPPVLPGKKPTSDATGGEKPPDRKLCTCKPPLKLSEGLNLPWIGPVRWLDPLRWLLAGVKNPLNVVTLVMVASMAVVISLNFSAMAHIALAMGVLESEWEEKLWQEFCNQILNAVGTLGCLVVHPLRCYYLVRLWRWSREDVASLRAVLSAAGPFVAKPNERWHLGVVLILLQLNCFGQYAIALFMWFVLEPDRPLVLLGFIVIIALGSLIAAGIYCSWSPLGWPTGSKPEKKKRNGGKSGGRVVPVTSAEEDGGVVAGGATGETGGSLCGKCGGVLCDSATDDDEGDDMDRVAQKHGLYVRLDDAGAGGNQNTREWKTPTWQPMGELARPQWQGSQLDCCADGLGSAVRTALCCFCVHGRNVERAGFGNKIVHTAMFIFFVFGPIVIFTLGSRPINSVPMQWIVFGLGVLTTIGGVTYGGYWRWKVRRTFLLPEEEWCCGHKAATDFAAWYVLPCCSLCQEVRTVRHYSLHMLPHLPDQGGEQRGAGGQGKEIMVQTMAPTSICMEPCAIGVNL
ncbi:hypothetical protein CLOM_g16357 [Closterium sp. NIES-68]|nr:hypothetical protein CLOM_g16357 [Closterium sp. NIES-68]GJP80400.1 hypothetical protein CLOP_g10606 [Closterium sp. NIES-67]